MSGTTDIAPDKVTEQDGLVADPGTEYHVYDLETCDHHVLGTGYTDGRELLEDAFDASESGDIHIAAHVAMFAGDISAEDADDLAREMNPVPPALLRVVNHPVLADVDPERGVDDTDDLSDAELLKLILDRQVWEYQSPHPESTSMRGTAALQEELTERGYDFDDYEEGIWSPELADDVVDA